jgi:hypothetical protein
MRPVISRACAPAQFGRTIRLVPTKGLTVTASTQPTPATCSVASRTAASMGAGPSIRRSPRCASRRRVCGDGEDQWNLHCALRRCHRRRLHKITRAQIVIASASVATKNSQRDKQRRSKDFLHTDEYPNIVFTLNSIAPTGASFTAHGGLTVAEVTKPLSVDLVPTHNDDGTITLATQLDIDRRDCGLTWNKVGMASTNNTVTIAATFSRN